MTNGIVRAIIAAGFAPESRSGAAGINVERGLHHPAPGARGSK